MSAANELNFENFSTFQSPKQPVPNTIASAATITPTTKLTKITGTTPVTKITPPVNAYHELTFIWATGTANGFNTGGSGAGAIAIAYTTITNRPVTLYYDPVAGLYYPMTVS